MTTTWGDFQAIIQLSAGLNVAILSFVDISIPAIKERRHVFTKARQELDIYRKNPHKITAEDKAAHADKVGEIDRQLFDLWHETSDFEQVEDSMLKTTGVFGLLGAILSISLLWYSGVRYDTTLPPFGMVLTLASFLSLFAAFCVNFFTAFRATHYTKRCNTLRQKMRETLK
ncbi:MAG: hypothetical protein ABF968_10020 [Acetobacter sp.]|uniref:DUF4231 domain-containing protein n=2 Tax=Acetobacter aceti TaxID=435 RepID=A0A6S6PKM4_ACEAC|nr:hypothetical protein [Acetobacter aceti]GBO81238.1 hypothetical protein AA0242T_1940 [Acetobacter aceti NRIC 0242]TCS27512.1 hypothetical protein EDC15_12512 [Acetobacter aceti NBRC 14818]BCI68388.1 hypothetical protein AAJCM20276_30120 [Acetobacter aceti]BCK75961.1 hypothetical protein EMQ_1567 [Acetobacter aceti NBRC 14818]GAN58859.1 hypothetical protein Abac_086_025 [Acetobacter aceti NBRC 14818]